MSGRKAFFTVLITLLVIAILVAAGVMLYRMGFSRGLAMAEALPPTGPFMHPYGYGMPGFDGACPRAWRNPGGMLYGGHMPFGMYGFGGWLVGLLLLAGFVALVVAGINALTRKHPAEVQAVAAPPAPPAPGSAPAMARPRASPMRYSIAPAATSMAITSRVTKTVMKAFRPDIGSYQPF